MHDLVIGLFINRYEFGDQLSLSRFMYTMPPRYGGPHNGWWTVHWPAVPPAFLDIPSVTVDKLHRLVPSFEAALQGHWGLCSPSIVSGRTSRSGTRII